MNKIYFLLFLIIISCNRKEDFKFDIKSVASRQVVLITDANLGEILEIDGQGNFYSTNRSTKQIYKYSKKGELLAETGRTGRGPNEFEKDKVLNIKVSKNFVLAHSIGGFVLNKYDTDLQLIDTYITKKPISDIALLNDQKMLISYLDLKTGNSIEIRDNQFKKLFDGFNTLRYNSPYYGFLSSASALSKTKLIVSYLAVNQIRMFSTEGKLLKIIKVPGFPDRAQSLKDIPIPAKAPAYLLFRDIYADSVNKNILILEGNRTHNKNNNALNYAGSNLVHYLSFEGKYKFTVKLPVNVEQIAYFDNHLYGLEVDSLTTKIIKFDY